MRGKWRESLHVLEFRHPPNFLWILAATPGFQNTTGLTVLSVVPFDLFFRFLLAWSISGRPDLSSTVVDTVTGKMSLSFSIRSFSILNFTYCKRRRRAGRRCWAMAHLSWKCPRSWWVRSRRRIWQAWNHNRERSFSVLHCITNPVLNEMWFLTVDPIHKNIRFHCKAFRATILLACFRGLSIYPILLTYTVASSCVCTSPLTFMTMRRTPRFRQSIHFSITQVLFLLIICIDARESTTKFSFLKFKSWCRQAPIFRRWEECCSLMLLYILTHTFGQLSTLLRGHLALATLSPSWDRSWNFGALGAALMRFTWANITERKDFGLEFWVWRAIAFMNFTRWIGFCMSELLRKIDFGGFMSWKTQPECRALDDRRPVGFRFNSWWVSRFISGRPRSLVIFRQVDNKLPYIFVPIILLQHGYCTFVIILLRPFC